MERPLDRIRKAEAAVEKLLAAAAERRRQVDLALRAESSGKCRIDEGRGRAAEKEVQRMKDYLEHWRLRIQ